MARPPDGDQEPVPGGPAAERLRQHLRQRFDEETAKELDPVPPEQERQEAGDDQADEPTDEGR